MVVSAKSVLVALVLLMAPALAGCAAPAATDPSAATDLRVAQVPEGARLTWDESPRGVAKSFTVYKDGKKLADVAAPTRTYLDATVEVGKTVSYVVAAVTPNGKAGPRTEPVTFTLTRTLALIQDANLNRGYVNLSVLQVSPGLRWDDLSVSVGGRALQLDDDAYEDAEPSWTHSAPRDPLADLGERLHILSVGDVVRNATLTVRLSDGSVLLNQPLAGRPTVNLTLRQERNATTGAVSFLVLDVKWRDGVHDVTPSYPDLVPRWSSVALSVNGTLVPYAPENRAGSWTHDTPTDDVIRKGNRLVLRSDLVAPTALVVVTDSGATEESFRARLK